MKKPHAVAHIYIYRRMDIYKTLLFLHIHFSKHIFISCSRKPRGCLRKAVLPTPYLGAPWLSARRQEARLQQRFLRFLLAICVFNSFDMCLQQWLLVCLSDLYVFKQKLVNVQLFFVHYKSLLQAGQSVITFKQLIRLTFNLPMAGLYFKHSN